MSGTVLLLCTRGPLPLPSSFVKTSENNCFSGCNHTLLLPCGRSHPLKILKKLDFFFLIPEKWISDQDCEKRYSVDMPVMWARWSGGREKRAENEAWYLHYRPQWDKKYLSRYLTSWRASSIPTLLMMSSFSSNSMLKVSQGEKVRS